MSAPVKARAPDDGSRFCAETETWGVAELIGLVGAHAV
jgi:hypothetical protein